MSIKSFKARSAKFKARATRIGAAERGLAGVVAVHDALSHRRAQRPPCLAVFCPRPERVDRTVRLLQDRFELTQGKETEMPETPTFGRYAEIPYDQMTPEQQEGYRSLLEARGRLPGPNKIYVHNPKLVKVMGPLGAYFRTGYSLSEREREIAVVIVNSKFHSAYPTNAHERAGKAAGLPDDKVEAMLSGLPTSFDDKREQVIYEMAKCLTESRWVSKGLFDRAVDALGHEGITDVICLMGFYTSVSMTLAFYDVPAGAEGLAR
jgi:4-carboxymuconolactone decarboxylase